MRSLQLASRLAATLAVLVVLLTSCQCGAAASQEATDPAFGAFDSSKAWTLLLEQVELGPRPSGSEENAKTRDLIARELESYGLKPVREPFVANTPGGDIAMENVYADFEGRPGKGGEPAPMLFIGAHFDTKILPFEFVGANDGASEVAAVLELARVICSGSPRAVTYRFVFFDGEEAVRRDWADPDNRYGSRHHVRELTKVKGALKRSRALILLDLVGDADLRLERDSNSTKRLTDIFVSTAKELGMKNLFNTYSIPIKDDHQSFLEFDIPAVDLIDLNFGKVGNEYWHTAEDTVDKCSEESLAKVGKLVLAALPKVEAAYGK